MKNNDITKLPMIPLRGLTVFPNMIVSFPVGREKSLEALEYAMKNGEKVFLITQKNNSVVEPKLDDVYKIGTVSIVKQILRLPANLTHVIVEGAERARLLDFYEESKCLFSEVEPIAEAETSDTDDDIVALMRIAKDSLDEYSMVNSGRTPIVETAVNVVDSSKPGQVADTIAAMLNVDFEQKQKLLETLNPYERLIEAVKILNHDMDIIKLKKEIEEKVKKKMDDSQREYYLREQLKVIQGELGDKDGVQADCEKYLSQLTVKDLKNGIDEPIRKEIARLSRMSVASPESNIIRNYIEYVLELPWNEKTEESMDIKEAERILDQDHYGLKKVKERVIEFLAVRQNAPESNSTILCLVGPPGVGKTSIAKSIAKALNRNYTRMSLGGVKDESEIRGHRKTYVGAMPGRIINAMKQAKTINPLMLLDEVDKLSVSYNGDPSSALLEVLDGEQNNCFRDHYIELPYDLSHVLFICTANNAESIPPALKDRMEIINITSYTAEEKKNIAIKHLIPKQLAANGLNKNQMKISNGAVESIIDFYVREAGVRELERTIASLCRKAVKIILSEEKESVDIDEHNLEDLLGTKKFRKEMMLSEPQRGVVRGLAWTEVGGVTLSVEANTMKGSGKLELTGNMGNVMQESAKAAMSYIRSNADKFRIEEEFYKDDDIHIHIPDGAVPKDGPSAGITMATAMLSALTGAKVRNDIAMTGEITIRGRVLPIGGLTEKILAAKKAGIREVIIPYDNEGDVMDIPKEIRKDMNFVFAGEMDEVLKCAIAEGESIWK